MSRVGKKEIVIPEGVEVHVSDAMVAVKGPKGELTAQLHEQVAVETKEQHIIVTPRQENQEARSLWGLTRSLINNLIVGVTEGFEKKLELNGVGYRAQLQGKTLKLSLGFSHDINFALPEGVEVAVPSPTEITVSGIDKQKVGQVAAEIRSYRTPEPYKGKGVRYEGEYVFRKEGKKK